MVNLFGRWALARVSYFIPLVRMVIQNDTSRPWTLVDVTGYIQACFYLLLWMPEKSLNQFVLYYGSTIYSGSLFMTFFLVDSSGSWMLGTGNANYKTWNAVYTPIFHWWVFAWIYRKQIGLATWIGSIQRKEDLSSPKPPPPQPMLSNLLKFIRNFSRISYNPAFVLFPLTSFLIYWFFRSSIPLTLVEGDVLYWPGTWTLLTYSAIISTVSALWLSFLTFQIQFTLWDRDWENGICVLFYDNDLSIGIVY